MVPDLLKRERRIGHNSILYDIDFFFVQALHRLFDFALPNSFFLLLGEDFFLIGRILLEEIQVGRHGLIVRRGPRSGLLLPQVAAEYGWDRETFLSHTCAKAGLPEDSWREAGTEIEIFGAEVFGEARTGDAGPGDGRA